MRDWRESLETELSALRPHAVSLEMRQRIAERLAEPQPAERRRLSWFTLAGSLAAACLVAVLLRWGGGVESKPIVVRRHPAPPVEVEDGNVKDSVPTLLAYQRAMARSPEELDALLDRQGLVAPETNPALVRIRAFTLSDSELRALLGDD